MRFVTAELAGTGGLFKAAPEDFVVEELPAYAPTGVGDHTFLFIEKRGLTTDEAVAKVARALAVSARDAGTAGLKDRHAVTRQWISLPAVEPARALALALDGVRVLAAARHPHKLRTGHLHGNRFTITLRGTTSGLERARAILSALAERGLPNWFGAQRFGARGDNAARGRALLDRAGTRTPGPPRERRLLVSAYQSELFNRYLDRRLAEDLQKRPILGDVLKKTDTGGLFTCAELDDAARRLAAGHVVVTGPIFGHKMMSPPDGTPARAREDALLAEEGIDAASFATLGKLAPGTRRALTVSLEGAEVEPGPTEGAIVLRFTLPPGAYATVLLGEVTKGNEPKPTAV